MDERNKAFREFYELDQEMFNAQMKHLKVLEWGAYAAIAGATGFLIWLVI